MRRWGAVNGSNLGAPISPLRHTEQADAQDGAVSTRHALLAGDEADDLPGVEPLQKQIPLAWLALDGRGAEGQWPVFLGQESAGDRRGTDADLGRRA